MRTPIARSTLAALLLVVALPLAAQNKKPQNLEPIPEPPPPPPGMEAGADEPQVTITKRGEDKVEEFRIRGKLYMVKVTPKVGKPYYLVDGKGDGNFARQDSLDSGIRVPMWVIKEF